MNYLETNRLHGRLGQLLTHRLIAFVSRPLLACFRVISRYMTHPTVTFPAKFVIPTYSKHREYVKKWVLVISIVRRCVLVVDQMSFRFLTTLVALSYARDYANWLVLYSQ